MKRLKFSDGESPTHQVNHYEFKFPNLHRQETSGGDFDTCSNKSEKEASFPLRKNKLIYSPEPSGDDYFSGYELEMEDTVVNLNDEIQKLHEELESKNTSIKLLQDELTNSNGSLHELNVELGNKNANICELKEELVKRSILLNEVHEELESKKTSIDILQDELLNSRTSIHDLKDKLENKITSFCEIKEELVKKSILLKEIEELKCNLSESVKRIVFLEQNLKEKNEALEVNNRLLETVKMELDHECESAFLKERELEKKEQEIRSTHENEILNLKQQYSEQLKDILDKNSLKEKFLEKQIEMLFSRIKELTERGETHQQEYETVKRVYEQEYNEMKSKVDEISKSSGSHIQELNNRLAASLSNEVALKVELKSKIDDGKKISQELDDLRNKYDDLLVNEESLCKRLKQTESQLDLLKEEKKELKNQLINANNLYEELNNNYNRDRKEMLKKQKDVINSYENDLCHLIKALEDLYHYIGTLFYNCNEELSYTESDDSIINLPIISKDKFSNSNCYGAMKIVCDSISESMKLYKEFKNLFQNYRNLRIAFDVRKKACEENSQQMAALQSEIMALDKEKESAENNLKYIEEQKDLLKFDNLKKNAEILELNNELMRYKEELDKLNHLQQQNETGLQLTNINLSPIVPDYKVASDCYIDKDEHMLSIQSRSLPATNKAVQLAASTPYQRNFIDPEGGGEFIKPKSNKSRNEVHLSLVKWMEKCHELDKQNKCLNAEVESLTVQIQDLQYSSQLLKEEMNAYEEKRIKLEQKLSNHLSLKQQYTELQDENQKLSNEAENLNKEVDYLKNENVELSKKNVQLEEKYRKYLEELSENKNLENNPINNEAIINSFNEKVQEVIGLKGEIRLLSNDKKYLTRRADLLLEANRIYCLKIQETYNQLLSCKNELEKIISDKMEMHSKNKILSKEMQLLQLRLDFFTTLRDRHRCSAGSLNPTEDLFQELIIFIKSIMENKFEADNSFELEDIEKGGGKVEKINLHEIIKSLNHQLNEEKLDFDGKRKELLNIINIAKNRGAISDDWIVQLDKKLRNIIEEMKFHKEQYNRIEEALRSTGKLHDELQKNKDQLRVKDHEISVVQKKLNEEKIQVKKFSYHMKYLQQELEEKNEIIKTSVDQKRTLEKELKDLQHKLDDAEKKYEMEIKAAEWKFQQAKLHNLENEVERKLIDTQKGVKWSLDDLGSEKWEKVREEVERVYQNALQQLQYFFNSEVSSSVAQVQEEHKEQIAEFQRIIDEQAIKIGMLMKQNTLEDVSNNDPVYINEEYKKQFELATFALQQLHQEEIQLLRLQLEGEKHFEIYKAVYENQLNVNQETICLKSTTNSIIENDLTRKLESALLEDFLLKMQNFICGWHDLYTKEVVNIRRKLQHGIDDYFKQKLNVENLKKIDNENQQLLNEYNKIISSAKDFLSAMETEHHHVITNLGTFVEIYQQKTGELFDQINIKHLESNEILVLQEELIKSKREKEELEKMHKNAIELLNADHKTEQAKIQILLTEIKQCFESGCDPNALLKLKLDLEERHKKELEDLRTYFEEKCANLGKQYSDDVNSLHSRMLSLSSSCSDEIISDHMGFDRGGAGDNNFMLSEIEVENVPTLEKLTPEQYKLIEELNFKWSENVKEMKKELEKKYSKKIEQLQEKLSTFVYNNELDITVRCIKEDVMRDCKLEIEDIKKEISSRLLASAEYSDDCSENTKEQLAAAFCERDAAWEQIVDVMGDSLSQDTINKITIEIIWDTLKKSDLQEKLVSKVSDLLSMMEDKLSVVSAKLKDKETRLFNLQNKMNSYSQFCGDMVHKLRNQNEINDGKKIMENSQLLEKLIEGTLEEMIIPPIIVQMKDTFQKLYENKLVKEKEKQSLELETLKKYYKEKENELYNESSALMENLTRGEFDERDWPLQVVEIKNILQEMFDKKLNEEKEKHCLELEHCKQLYKDYECVKNVCATASSDLDQIIQERDNLKEMTVTLKSAVGQLVSYLNTCEDELNKTVVEELIKVSVETPKRTNSDYESLEITPEFKKVHFAPEVGISDLDSSQDISSFLRLQLDSCLSKLKVEAASLLGLTAMQPPPANLTKQIESLTKENEELLQEVAELKLRLYKDQNDSLELRDEFAEDLKTENSFTYLQDKAQQILVGTRNIPPEAAKILEDIARLGDSLIHELQKEKIDLQQQIDAADKQLKSTRQFLEEQAAERETERDDYSKEITNLQSQLKEKGKNLSFHERFTTEVLEPVPQKLGKVSLSVEELEQQLKESNMHLEECEKKKGIVEAELKDAIDKVWVLRDIISDLESQLTTKSEKEALLEQKLDELETELDQQNGTQYAMAQELESLRSQSLDDGCYLEQIKQLEENIKVQFNSSVVRQLKTQLRDLEKTLDHRTKELETVYLNNSSNSLSSPSEEVSVREQLEWTRSHTPEQCPSPVALPVEEVSKLHDKFLRHVRSEEMLIKRLRDQQLITVKLQVELEEMHAEREVLQKQMKKQMVLLAEANNKIDDLRHKVETAQTTTNKDLISQIQELKEKYNKAEQALDSTHNQLMEHKIQLAHAEEIIGKQKIEISNLAHCDHEIVDSLRLELAAVTAERNKLEDLLDKHKRDFNLDVVNALLVDKNEDIDHLQHTVNILQSQKEDDDKHGSCNSKGYRVSFAADIENSNLLAEEMRLRDAANMRSLDLYPENNFQVFGGSISPIPHETEEKQFCTSLKSFSLSDESILGRTDNESEDDKLIENLKSELLEKNDKIVSLEKEIEYLKSIEEDLKNTKFELQAVVSSVTEDKKYYENEIHFMSEKLTKKEEEVKKLRGTIQNKDEEILKTTGDVQSLREISLNLQEKLKEAKELAEKENIHVLKDGLAHLNEELLSKEKEISELEHELQLFKSDYNDEKELCQTLKSSLNFFSAEKQNLEENISSLRNENCKLLNELQTAEDRLNQYVIAVRNLKNDLSSKSNALESKHVSSNPNIGFIENEILTLQEEVVKLMNLNENLFQERNNILEELNKLKLTINCEDYAKKESLITQLQDELNELRKAVHSVKEEKLAAFANFSKEICQLHKDIDNLQDSKRETLEKWKQELLEKEALQRQLESLELEVEKCHNEQEQELLSRLSRKRKLSFCGPGILEIPPVSDFPVSKLQKLTFCRLENLDIQPVTESPAGIDALADKMRKEIKLSATLDNSLLESILPDENPEGYRKSPEPSGAVNGHLTITSRLRSLEKALLTEMEKAREARNGLRDKEAKYRVSEAEKNEMKLRIERLQRMLVAHEEKIGLMSNQLKMEKDKIITLELTVSKEQASIKKMAMLLEEERNKARESQKDDIALIETMRKRLQSLMENETILKQIVREERQKSNTLLAQLNSARALEQYRSDSEEDNHKNCQKILLQERDKYFKMKVECEKERRTCEDLREVIVRERTALCYLQDSLAKTEKARSQIEKELTSWKQKLNEEMVRRELADKRAAETQGLDDSKFQKQLLAIESRNKKSLDAAYAVIRELEQEYNDLKVYIRSQQEQDEKWKDRVHLPLIQQLNEVNDNLDALIKERVELKRTIEKINEENNRLHSLIDELKRVTPTSERLSIASNHLEVPNLRLQRGSDVLTPFIEREVDDLLDRVLRAERHKKALVFQKRYLLVALRGYQDAHRETINQLRWHHYNHRHSRKFSFRSVAFAVIAIFKMIRLPLKRIGTYHKRREVLLSTLHRSLSRSTAEMERLTSAPTSSRVAPHSPPSRERANLRFR